MDLDPVNGAFRLRDRIVRPDQCRIVRANEVAEVEPKAMEVLMCLVRHAGQVVSTDDLIDEVWDGRPMGDNPVYKCIARLRRALGDDAHDPRFIETVHRRGYLLMCAPQAAGAAADTAAAPGDAIPRVPSWAWWTVAAALLFTFAIVLYPRQDRQVRAVDMPSDGSAVVLVLPFEDLSRGTETVPVAEILSEECRAQLARLPGLRVVSRTAARSVHARNPTLGEIRADLNAGFVLEGDAQLVDDRVRYRVRLVDTGNGQSIWSRAQTRDFDDILEIQHDIARSVVDALRIKLGRALADPVRSTHSARALVAYQRGKSYLHRSFEPEYMAAAQSHFSEALSHDPGYARAYAGLCEVFRRRYRREGTLPDFDEAEANCLRAEELDADLAEVQLSLGQLYRTRGEPDRAVMRFERALELDANELDHYSGLAYAYVALNEADKAEALFRRAIEMFPTIPAAHARYGVMLYRLGRYTEALGQFETARRLGAKNNSIVTSMGASYFMLGDFEMAVRKFRESLATKGTPNGHSSLGTAYYYLGRFDEAVEHYRIAIELAPADYTLWSNLAAGLRQMPGQDEAARAACAQAIALADGELSVNPDDAAVISRVASCRAYLGYFDEARAAVDRAVSLAPNETNVLYSAALALCDLNDLGGAADMIERAMARGYPRQHVDADAQLRAALPHLQ